MSRTQFPPDAAAIAALFRDPAAADTPFADSGCSRGQVFALAARLLETLGSRGRDPVCLATERREIIAAALLAALAGGPVLLLPYALSAQALMAMREATGFTTAITDADQELPPGIAAIRLTATTAGRVATLPAASPSAELLRIYSGGTTNTPRIWPKTGENLFAEALFLCRHFGMGDGDRIMATVSPLHIYGLLFSVAVPLVCGATVLAQTPSYPGEIGAAAARFRPTILASVPAHYRALHGRPLTGTRLRLAFSSAGMLDAGDNFDFARGNATAVVEVYGSTETGGIASRNRSLGEEGFTPFPVVDWRLDGQRLQVRSPFLSPCLSRDADGFFHLADRVEPCGSGFLLQGRADAIAKVGGKRVDLEEIRSLILSLPGIADCAVVALAEGSGRENRIAALVAGEGTAIDAIRPFLTGRLEPYALPRLIVTVPRIPTTAAGKQDRDAILRLLQR